MSSGAYEVQTGMDSSVMKGNQPSLDLQLLLKVAFKLLVTVISDGLAAKQQTQVFQCVLYKHSTICKHMVVNKSSSLMTNTKLLYYYMH